MDGGSNLVVQPGDVAKVALGDHSNRSRADTDPGRPDPIDAEHVVAQQPPEALGRDASVGGDWSFGSLVATSGSEPGRPGTIAAITKTTPSKITEVAPARTVGSIHGTEPTASNVARTNGSGGWPNRLRAAWMIASTEASSNDPATRQDGMIRRGQFIALAVEPGPWTGRRS